MKAMSVEDKVKVHKCPMRLLVLALIAISVVIASTTSCKNEGLNFVKPSPTISVWPTDWYRPEKINGLTAAEYLNKSDTVKYYRSRLEYNDRRNCFVPVQEIGVMAEGPKGWVARAVYWPVGETGPGYRPGSMADTWRCWNAAWVPRERALEDALRYPADQLSVDTMLPKVLTFLECR